MLLIILAIKQFNNYKIPLSANFLVYFLNKLFVSKKLNNVFVYLLSKLFSNIKKLLIKSIAPEKI